MTSTANPILLMRITDMIADLDAIGTYLIGRCAAGDNDELDHLGRMADVVAAAADFLFALRYGG
jgi:hypothetical protein